VSQYQKGTLEFVAWYMMIFWDDAVFVKTTVIVMYELRLIMTAVLWGDTVGWASSL